MENKKYSIGLDYGTQSGRAVLVDVSTGDIVAQAVKEYTHGVIDEYLPDSNIKLGHDWALEHPGDYLEVVETTIPEVLRISGVRAEDVIGISVDFTACTILPIDKDGLPLMFHEDLKGEPHAWLKLWKHHAAQSQANKLNKIAKERGEKFLARYGGKISSEWMIPKLMQILDEAPEIYETADRFMEAADWITMMLTGEERRNSCTAGYKDMWHKQEGFPSKEFFKALDPRLENVVEDKLNADIYPLGGKAGELTKEMAEKVGLMPGTSVGIPNIDAHVAVPAVGITEPGKMLMIMGTSTCHIMLNDKEVIVPGMCGVVEDGVIPGYFGYEAGQACVGDHFEWFVENCVSKEYYDAAKAAGQNIHQYLTEKAGKLKVGESGLIALDWWNGNRSVLVDADLTGMILGCTLLTKPEEIYRALIEATAYGTKMIIDTFEKTGVAINELFACGGISKKNKLMMQIYSDVTNREIRISSSDQTPALGAAMFAAVAAGKEKGGYDSIVDAAKVMGKVEEEYYKPIKENVLMYDRLYKEYERLHDYLGKGENDVMKHLKAIKTEARKK
ncbi:L-ribulokinase [Mobilisporobacter senegalensis]|uniref:Ribulokinase n=1 Tax=Mobilisporobacter senegalensis TaxID=1329262 RepID=A0A3N1XI80_9FIRM|nr:ribulokinase [Mobilisporobacter senegalensis]ROR26385.1 L-ribulokinase [Mobilisporobacter senegalensis]